jgi:signal transduction histidine kinase
MKRIAGGLAGVSVLLIVGAVAFAYHDHAVLPANMAQWSSAWFSEEFLGAATAVLGYVITSRRPGNRIGLLAQAAGACVALSSFAKCYALHALVAYPGSLPFGHLAMWIYWVGAFPVWAVLGLVLLLFPDGRLPGPGWRPAAWYIGTIFVWSNVQAIVGACLVWSHPFVGIFQVYTPGAFAATRPTLPIALALCAAAVVGRFIKSTGEERLQLTWFAAAATVLGVVLIPRILINSALFAIMMNLAVIGLEVTIAIAVLRYRLYDIDIVISRAVRYAALAAFITAVYAGLVAGVGAVVGDRFSPLLSAVAAAVVAVAFQPVRERAARLADRVVYGRRASPYQVLSDFAGRIGGAFSVEDVLPELARVVAAGTGARRVVVWLRVGDQLRPVTSTDQALPVAALPRLAVSDAAVAEAGSAVPDAVAVPVAVTVPDGMAASDAEVSQAFLGGQAALDGLPDADVAVPVLRDGRLLGAIGITMPRGEPLRPAGRQLVSDVASQAGLALANAGLVADLRASRQRLVSAQDEARRRLERDLHDGAQQDLVAIVIKARLAAEHSADLAEATEALADLRTDAATALENLRDLARGIYPPLLADLGLAAALAAQAKKSMVPVTVDAAGLGRMPEETEAAVYFCCLEALQNTAKYAAASVAAVKVRAGGGTLTFNVTDDGAGFDAARTPLGAGLRNMADRLAALGGSLDVTSAPGHGTTITGRLPAR